MLNAIEAMELFVDRVPKTMDFLIREGLEPRVVGTFGRLSVTKQPNVSLLALAEKYIDLDVLLLQYASATPEQLTVAKNLALPVNLDIHYPGKISLQSARVVITYKEICKTVDPRIFDQQQGEILGVEIPTVDARTHLHLGYLYGPMRPKDFSALIQFAQKIRNQKTLSEKLFEPFHILEREIHKKYPKDVLLADLRAFYHRKIPYEYRRNFSPIMQILKGLIEKKFGEIEDPYYQRKITQVPKPNFPQ